MERPADPGRAMNLDKIVSGISEVPALSSSCPAQHRVGQQKEEGNGKRTRAQRNHRTLRHPGHRSAEPPHDRYRAKWQSQCRNPSPQCHHGTLRDPRDRGPTPEHDSHREGIAPNSRGGLDLGEAIQPPCRKPLLVVLVQQSGTTPCGQTVCRPRNVGNESYNSMSRNAWNLRRRTA